MIQREIANRESFSGVEPMGDLRSPLAFSRKFTLEEYKELSLGVIPRRMEEKWLIFLEDDCLYFHRSWTGACIYQLTLKGEGDSWLVSEAWVQRDPDKYKNTDGSYDVALLSFLVDNFLLGKSMPFPLPSDLPEDLPEGIYQLGFSGSAFPEVPFNRK